MKSVSVGLSSVLFFQLVANGGQLPPVPAPRMNIIALEGEGAINDVRKRQPRNIVVQVRDGNRSPLAGVTVNFALPLQGPSGEFFDGSKTLTITSDQEGRATARGFRPNSAPGNIGIRVDASHGQESASLVVTQFNMEVTGSGGSGKWIALIGILGGAAAGGAYAATRGSSSSSPTPSAPIVITPGTGTVGRPR
jgi:hypothetical protein